MHTRGMILMDVMVAFAMSVALIIAISDMSMSARSIFERAHIRSGIVHDYLISSSSSITVASKPFGNDLVENDISIQSKANDGSQNSDKEEVTFAKVEIASGTSPSDFIGTPFCSVDFLDPYPIGSYVSKQTETPTSVHINPIQLLTNGVNVLFTDIQVRDGIAYITSDTPNSSDPDLLVFDIHDHAHGQLLASINTGIGLISMALVGKKVYAASPSSVGQLHTLFIASPSSIESYARYKLPLPQSSTTPTLGSSIFFNNGLIYLGTEKWDGDELNIIDVLSSTSPVKIGGFEAGTKIQDINVSGNTAYVADSDQLQLRQINITDKTHPVLSQGFSPSGWSRQNGEVADVFENNVTFGRTTGGFDIVNDHELFVFNPDHSINIPGGIYGIVRDRRHIYVITHELGKEFQIFDQLLSTSAQMSFGLPAIPVAMTCDGDHIYIISNTSTLYDISFK